MSPLAGITVVSLEQAIAAPLCTRHLADLGARCSAAPDPGVGGIRRPDPVGPVGDRGAPELQRWLERLVEADQLVVRRGGQGRTPLGAGRHLPGGRVDRPIRHHPAVRARQGRGAHRVHGPRFREPEPGRLGDDVRPADLAGAGVEPDQPTVGRDRARIAGAGAVREVLAVG